jgi:hypothetical protein
MSQQNTLVRDKGIRGGRYVENDVIQRQWERMDTILSPNKVPWCRLRGYGVGGMLRTKQCIGKGNGWKIFQVKTEYLGAGYGDSVWDVR